MLGERGLEFSYDQDVDKSLDMYLCTPFFRHSIFTWFFVITNFLVSFSFYKEAKKKEREEHEDITLK